MIDYFTFKDFSIRSDDWIICLDYKDNIGVFNRVYLSKTKSDEFPEEFKLLNDLSKSKLFTTYLYCKKINMDGL